MTATGHNARTQAVVEHMRRRSETHRETKLELPPGLADILQTMSDEILALKADVSSLKSALVEACSHLKDAA